MRLVLAALRLLGLAFGALVLLLALVIVIVPPFLDRIYYEGPRGWHFDGARFFNPEGTTYSAIALPRQRLTVMIDRLMGGSNWPGTVPVTPLDARALPPLKPGEMRAVWVGHATVLVQAGRYNILTDPIWSQRPGPFGLTGPRRTTAPGIRLADLPRIDAIVVSHNHYDHLDLDTLGAIWRRDRPRIVTGLGNETIIARSGAQATVRDWGGTVDVAPGLRIHVVRNHHWSSRWFVDKDRALWSAFLIETPAGRVFFSGDTGFGNGLWVKEAAALGPIRLALLPIGAFRFTEGQLASDAHIGPGEAVEVFRELAPAQAIGVHWGTFRLSDEERDTPPRLVDLFMECAGLDKSRFAHPAPGVPLMIPAERAAPLARHRDAKDCAAGSPVVAAFK